MKKLDNYIYLTICEVAMNEMKKTNYVSFVSFCKGIAYSLKAANLSSKETGIIINITNMLDKIYSMDEVATANYVVDFFLMDNERILVFQKCVMETQEFYPMSCD
jgi:hypothetical protein